MTNSKPNAQTGALTLVLLVKLYRNQMISLLVKNGVLVPENASEQQITTLMANLLKVSKSFSQDLSNFISNPSVANMITSGIQQTAQYSNMSGKGYMNSTGGEDGFTDTGESAPVDPVLDSANTGTATPPKKGFFSDFNLSDFLNSSMKLFGDYTKGKSDEKIAEARVLVEQAKAQGKEYFTDPTTGEKVKINDDKPKDGLSTTTIVVLSLVGVALLGTVVFFALRPKKQ